MFPKELLTVTVASVAALGIDADTLFEPEDLLHVDAGPAQSIPSKPREKKGSFDAHSRR